MRSANSKHSTRQPPFRQGIAACLPARGVFRLVARLPRESPRAMLEAPSGRAIMAKIISLTERWRWVVCGGSAVVTIFGAGAASHYASRQHAMYDGWLPIAPFQKICPEFRWAIPGCGRPQRLAHRLAMRRRPCFRESETGSRIRSCRVDLLKLVPHALHPALAVTPQDRTRRKVRSRLHVVHEMLDLVEFDEPA